MHTKWEVNSIVVGVCLRLNKIEISNLHLCRIQIESCQIYLLLIKYLHTLLSFNHKILFFFFVRDKPLFFDSLNITVTYVWRMYIAFNFQFQTVINLFLITLTSNNSFLRSFDHIFAKYYDRYETCRCQTSWLCHFHVSVTFKWPEIAGKSFSTTWSH